MGHGMSLRRRVWIAAVAAAGAAAVGAGPGGCAATTRSAERPARINHVVFAKLKEPAHADELIADSDRMLRTIPTVRRYFCGTHLDTGRASVLSDYDVAAYMGFDTEEDYRAYVEHPAHVELVERWRPRLEWLRVYDVLDETP